MVIDVGGVAVSVVANPSYSVFATDRIGSLRSVEQPTIVLRLGPDQPVPPDRDPDQHLEMIDSWFEGDDLWMKLGGAVTLVSGNEVVVGGPIDGGAGYKSIDLMVQFGLAAAMASPDRIMVHGAVVSKNDEALLVVGKSGRGKSTAATAAMANGWDLLTDDLAVAHPVKRRVRGVARPPRIPADLANAYGIEGRLEPGERGRMILDEKALAEGDRRLAGLVMVDHGDAGSLARLQQADLHAIDDALAVPPFGPVMRRHLVSAAALVAIPTFRLLHAADEAIRADRALELLDEALRLAIET